MSAFFKCQHLLPTQASSQREVLWLLSPLRSLSDDGVNPNLLDVPQPVNIQLFCIQPWIYIFNSFVSEEEEEEGKVKPNHHRVTKLVYCLLLMPSLATSGCQPTFYYQYQSWNGPLFGQHAVIQFVMISCLASVVEIFLLRFTFNLPRDVKNQSLESWNSDPQSPVTEKECCLSLHVLFTTKANKKGINTCMEIQIYNHI